MNDLIRKKDAIGIIIKMGMCTMSSFAYERLLNGIEDLPLVEPEERTAKVNGAGFGLIGHCECGTPIMSGKWEYCPTCGCKLDWNDDE